MREQGERASGLLTRPWHVGEAAVVVAAFTELDPFRIELGRLASDLAPAVR